MNPARMNLVTLVVSSVAASRASGASQQGIAFFQLGSSFGDADGFSWELAHNPFFPLDPSGAVTLPE